MEAHNSAYTKPRLKRKPFLEKAGPWLVYGNLLALPYRASLRARAGAARLCAPTAYVAIAPVAPQPPPNFRRALGSLRQPPADGTFRYWFSRLDLTAFAAALASWIQALAPRPPEQLRPTPLDGKTLRGMVPGLFGLFPKPPFSYIP